MRSNADRRVGLSLYTDWQLKTKKRALAGHASKNNRQEERAPCLTRVRRFGRFENNRREERAPCLTRGTRSADSRSKPDGHVPGRHALSRFEIKAGWTRARYAVRTRACTKARACNRARVRVPSLAIASRLAAPYGAWRRQQCTRLNETAYTHAHDVASSPGLPDLYVRVISVKTFTFKTH